MLGSDFDLENSESDDKSNLNTNNTLSTANVSRYVDPKIVEDEIAIAEEIKFDQETKKHGSNRKGSVDELVEDFDNYSDDGFDGPDKADDTIVDEVEEEDTLKMIEAEICNTALAKQDITRVKNLINKIDEIGTSNGKSSKEKLHASLTGSNQGSFSQKTKPIDQLTKFNSSSKVVVSKYSKNSSKTNLHDNSLSGKIFAQRMANKSGNEKSDDDIKDELDELEGSTDLQDRALESLDNSEDDIDTLIQKHLESDSDKRMDDVTKAKKMLGGEKVDSANKDNSGGVEEEPLSPSEESEESEFDE